MGCFVRVAHEMNVRGRGARCRFYVAGTIFENHRAYYEGLCALAARLDVDNVALPRREGGRAGASATRARLRLHVEARDRARWLSGKRCRWAMPVLSTDVGDVRELFEAHRCGLVAGGREPRELADSARTTHRPTRRGGGDGREWSCNRDADGRSSRGGPARGVLSGAGGMLAPSTPEELADIGVELEHAACALCGSSASTPV